MGGGLQKCAPACSFIGFPLPFSGRIRHKETFILIEFLPAA